MPPKLELMYAFIEGRVIEKNPAYVILETQGIGYQLHISLNTYTGIGDQERCRLFTHFVVREDAQLLYGFADQEERDLFRLLISVSGIGPNTARLLLSSMSTRDLSSAIAGGQAALLKSVKGIGEKSAQRIIVDLRDKVEKGAPVAEKVGVIHNTLREEALSGLVVLGFQKKSVEKVLDQIIREFGKKWEESGNLTVEMLIREALKNL